MAVNFMHVNSGNYSITAKRNAWVGSFVCLFVCYGEQIYTELLMVEGATTLNGGLHNRTMEGKIRSRIGEQCRQAFFF
jgi:hypothetical protein